MTMTQSEKELQKATGVKPKGREDRTVYLERLADEADKLPAAKWETLSQAAQQWANDANNEFERAKERGVQPNLNDFDDNVEAEEPEEADEPEAEADEPAPRKGRAKANKPGAEPETEDKKVARTSKKNAAPAKAAAAKETTKAAPAKGLSDRKLDKLAKTAKTAKGKNGKNGASENGNGIREGTKNAKLLALISKPGGATLAEMLKLTGWKECRGTASILARKVGKQLTSIKKEGKDTRWAAV